MTNLDMDDGGVMVVLSKKNHLIMRWLKNITGGKGCFSVKSDIL
jgi:hypothetical protein